MNNGSIKKIRRYIKKILYEHDNDLNDKKEQNNNNSNEIFIINSNRNDNIKKWLYYSEYSCR